MIEVALAISGLLNFFLIGFILYQQANKKASNDVEIKHFEYIEEISGKVTDSKKYVIKGQIYVNKLPVGQQFVMSEHIIENFDYNKLKEFKNEIVHPVLQLGAKAAETYFNAPALQAKGLIKSAVKAIKSKAS